ncbi:amino acid/amide ABC transporter ATP-binding protein 2 [Striga asiatica]|uniref:Amino acid/amide ABC transporter ATP-binding protein 2 n=1 Tax=Striga asiatica TaxID=4170 RepID=A0A5A7Q873_STRAF|nr:amino acid/amide ABC transporter ATP-binding protein 2 [Striga asiatica]
MAVLALSMEVSSARTFRERGQIYLHILGARVNSSGNHEMGKSPQSKKPGGNRKETSPVTTNLGADEKNRDTGKRKADRDVSCVNVKIIVPTSNQPDSSDDFVEECPCEGKAPEFVQEFASKTRILANTGVEILRLVEKAPQVLFDDETFVKMQSAAQKFIGFSSDDSKLKSKINYSQHKKMQRGSTDMDPNHPNQVTLLLIRTSVLMLRVLVVYKFIVIIVDEVAVAEQVDGCETGGNANNIVFLSVHLDLCVGAGCDDGLTGNTRPKRQTNGTSAIKSPFKERLVYVNTKLDAKENMDVTYNNKDS